MLVKTNSKVFRKPAWLNKKISLSACHKMDKLISKTGLHTVCHEAKCPNISECFAKGIATFLILGDVCTRSCRFCAIKKGIPDNVDMNEAGKIRDAVKLLELKHVVLTSVTRDDLKDGGAFLFVECIREIKKSHPETFIEVLVPDFKGNMLSVENIIKEKPDIFAHNLETVPRIYGQARKEASYKLSLNILKTSKELSRSIYTKSGIMLGLGEKEEEVLSLFDDLIGVGCDFISIGQYLAPGNNHIEVKEYIKPDKFKYYERKAKYLGFKHVESGSYVRSSYMASSYLENKA